MDDKKLRSYNHGKSPFLIAMLNYQKVPFDRSWMDSPVFSSHIQMSLDDLMMDDIERFFCSSAASAFKSPHMSSGFLVSNVCCQ